jgi:processive 1,2-diacylglycerol beta-glucosyltransferase
VFRPDRIVCTHFLPAEILSHEIAGGRAGIPVYVQVTDFDLHPMWVTPGMAGYYAANEEVAARLTACGPVVATVRVTGIPVMPDFDPPRGMSRDAARREFALGEQGPIVLLMGGGSGIGDLTAQAEALLDLDQTPAVIALAGRSAAALAGLQKLAAHYPGRLMPMGFTDRVSDLMRAADLIVTKPGGLSTSECLALGRPMILSAPIPGQEERNADYLLEEGAALKAIDVLALRLRAGALLGDPPRLARMAKRARAIGRPYAARDVLDQVLA